MVSVKIKRTPTSVRLTKRRRFATPVQDGLARTLTKKSVWTEFQNTGRVSTVFGNHYRRTGSGKLTGKEKRAAVSQVVQGTASLIFKRALLAVASIGDVRVVLPMHDALLFEHTLAETPDKVVSAFEEVMTDVLNSLVAGKASISDFVERY